MALQLWQDVVKAAPDRLVLIWQMIQLTRPLVDARVNLNTYPKYYDAFSIAPTYNALITEMSGRQPLTTGSNAGAMDLQSAYAGMHEFWYAVRDYYAGKNAESCDAAEALRIQELMHAFTEEDSGPAKYFVGGEKGFWIDPSDTSTLFQNSDGTIPVTANGDPIGLVLDKSGNNYNLTQTVSASRPKLLNGGIVFDKVDDALTLTVPAGGITGTLFLATTRGTASYGVSMPAGVWTLGNAYNPLGDVVSAVLVDRALTEDEKARLHAFGSGKGGTEFGVEAIFDHAFREWGHLVDFPLIDTSRGTSFNNTWSECSGLTSFPVLDVSNGVSFTNAWRRCQGLSSFPLLDVSSATAFNYAWFTCSRLASFPANFFDNCLATFFSNAFNNTNLSQESIDGILVSINSNATSNGTFNQSGGSTPSAVGKAAIDAMRARGWTVTTTGGY